MKKFLKLLILTISILIVSIPVFASETMITSAYDTMLINEDFNYDTTIANTLPSSISVQLNGEYIDFTDAEGNKVEPQIVNSRTMVPMRKIFEVFGATVEWSGETRSIEATTEELVIGLQIDNKVATVTNKSGDVTEIELDSAPVIIDNRTLVPVRFIAESLDKKVGWDADNRTVIIIDTTFIGETLKENASNLYEYLTTDFEKIETCEMSVDINGKVKYTDSEIIKNNTTLNLVGDMDIKLSETAMQLDLNLNFTGKGMLLETVKENELEKIKASVIMDIENSVLYIKSPLMEGYEDKWIKAPFTEEEKTEFKAVLDMAKITEKSNLDMMVDLLITEDNFTVTSYTEIESIIQLITMFMGNDNFKVAGRTTKTYTYNIDLSEIMEELLPTEEMEENPIKLEFGFDVKVANGVEKESNLNIAFEFEQETEKVEVDIIAEGILESYNKTVTIKLPNEKDVVDLYAE